MAKPFAIHPKEILLTEFMGPHGLTAYRLAKELCVPVPRVNGLVRGNVPFPRTRRCALESILDFPRSFG